MKIASIVLSTLTILMALSQLICGLWLQSHGAERSSILFHTQLGIGTVVMTLITIIVMLVFILKRILSPQQNSVGMDI
jgi:hypothetical protein